MEKDKNVTEVIFRKYKDGEIIALFPYVLWDKSGDTIMSYMHVGQHGSAEYGKVVYDTKLATPSEYEQLRKELEGLRYNLLCVSKCFFKRFIKIVSDERSRS